MKNTTAWFLIILGVMMFFASYIVGKEELKGIAYKRAQIAQINNETLKLKKEAEDLHPRIYDARMKRMKLETQASELAFEIFNARSELRRRQLQQDWFVMGKEREVEVGRIYEDMTVTIKDALTDEIAILANSKDQVNTYFDNSSSRLDNRQAALDKKSKESDVDHDKRASELLNDNQKLKNTLHQTNRRTHRYLTEPNVQGEVLQSIPEESKIILNIGKLSGIKQNFRFKVFGITPGGDRVYKGMVVIKEVEDFVCVGLLMEKPDRRYPVVKGDKVGSLAFGEGGLRFYLAGKFDTKYEREELVRYLEYMGNEIASDLDHQVDILVEGKFADKLLARATGYGIGIIREEDLVPFVGD